MNTRKFTGDMTDQIEKDRDELIELRAKCERLEGEVEELQKAGEFVAQLQDDYNKAQSTIHTLTWQCAEMRSALDAVDDLISESTGVTGLHQNGDVAPWSELQTGGRFEEWLVPFDKALSTTAGTAILARLEEARRLLVETDSPDDVLLSWYQRRDAWLKGQP